MNRPRLASYVGMVYRLYVPEHASTPAHLYKSKVFGALGAVVCGVVMCVAWFGRGGVSQGA